MKQGPLEIKNKPKRHSFLDRVASEEVFASAFKIWQDDLSIANKIALEALEIITETYVSKPIFYAEKARKE